ncbi:hypothetical protein CORC01_06130 [Colletotrichum orchidophilum]|uniref:Alpha N-terminal protein methyltransferase 1 n=1 Tax=Colletotrichum orchidophilum TaxID=1209926 RepID=A0A1G4BAR1_9PEZI|nr:uncharacterized protein CORC01_06130 [Colletotrichum orchidophilum]OHE98509.1 hypothetical protein CORC01_06130 [Colletotrichum orchidophilum]
MSDAKSHCRSDPPDVYIMQSESLKHWESISADVSGMLGGVPVVDGFCSFNKIDLQGSRAFLAKLGIGLKNGRSRVKLALEGGAGIGRITTGLLLDIAEQVDVVEPIARFTASLQETSGIRSIYNIGLDRWHPEPGVRYDLIWTQWCLGHLTDEQLVQYLQRCVTALTPGCGLIIIKENLSTSGTDAFDHVDSSVTREDSKFQALFKQANLRIVRTEMQKGLPKVPQRKLLPIKMYALKPQE